MNPDFEEVKQKFIDYWGDDKPKTPLQWIKAAIELKIPIAEGLIEAVEDMHGKSIWKKLGGRPIKR